MSFYSQGSVIVDCNWTFSKTKKFVKTEDTVPPTFDFNIDTDVLEETLNKIPEVVHVNIPGKYNIGLTLYSIDTRFYVCSRQHLKTL